MQHISDNEFDRFFKDGLGDAEVQPSESLWDKIEPQISPKKRPQLPFLWLAAASVALVLSAGLLFMQSDKQLDVTPIAKIKSKVKSEAHIGGSKASVKSGNESLINSEVDRPAFNLNANLSTKAAGISLENRKKSIVDVQKDQSSVIKNDKSLIAMQPIPVDPHLSNTTVDYTAESALTENQKEIDTETALASAQRPSATALDEVLEAEQPERARIRNAGDLVNFVVDKIDKREQKILEFKTDDDDNSSLVAINIGPFKLNQRKHK
jgi:hypothetical protein